MCRHDHIFISGDKPVKKQLDLDLVPGAVKMLRKNGIHVNGFFMCGIRDETRQEINDSIKLALKTPFSRIQVSVYVPYPGSEDFDTIFHVEDTKFYEEHVMKFQEGEHIPRFHGFTVDEMYKIQREFLTRFYFRPGVIWSLLKEMRFSQMRALFINPDIRMWFKKEKKWYSSSGGER